MIDGTSTTWTDDWRKDQTTIQQQEWTGETWFFKAGCESDPAPGKRRTRPAVGGTAYNEAEVIDQLVSKGEYDREDLVDSMTTCGLERTVFAAAQRRCPELAVYYAAALAIDKDEDPKQILTQLAREDRPLFGTRSIDAVINVAKERHELVNNLLLRRCYDAVDDELKLKCCVPDVLAGQVEVPGVGLKPMVYRDKIIFEYHNGPFVGHCGRDRTLEMLERDFWWGGMYTDVVQWCK